MTYLVQTWNDQERVHDDINGLNLASAREIAVTHANLLGYTARIMANGVDYCEVYTPGKVARKGTFAETTIVTI